MKSNPGALRSALFLFSISFYLTLFSQVYNTRCPANDAISKVGINRDLAIFASISSSDSNFSWAPLSVSDTIKKKDRDGDGIVDSLDKCPDEKGSIQYDGCPVPDSDNDGVPDDNDACPTIPGTVKYKGCPIPDSDGDKINDEDDKCPHQAGVARYAGCPVGDRDRDGVNDDDDKCIDVPGSINNAGCPENKKASLQPSREKKEKKGL